MTYNSILIKIIVSFLFISSSLNAAEYVYVTDKLYLGLHTKASSDSKRIKLMKSGVKLEVITQKGRYKKVKTPSGAIGWAKSQLLVNEPTAALKLEQYEKELRSLKQEGSELNKQLLIATQNSNTAQQAITELEEKLILSQTKNIKLTQNIGIGSLEVKEIVKPLPENALAIIKGNIFYIAFTAGISVFALIMFLLGRRSCEIKIRSKFNGYRIW
jgi:SH3 domain protein